MISFIQIFAIVTEYFSINLSILLLKLKELSFVYLFDLMISSRIMTFLKLAAHTMNAIVDYFTISD